MLPLAKPLDPLSAVLPVGNGAPTLCASSFQMFLVRSEKSPFLVPALNIRWIGAPGGRQKRAAWRGTGATRSPFLRASMARTHLLTAEDAQIRSMQDGALPGLPRLRAGCRHCPQRRSGNYRKL